RRAAAYGGPRSPNWTGRATPVRAVRVTRLAARGLGGCLGKPFSERCGLSFGGARTPSSFRVSSLTWAANSVIRLRAPRQPGHAGSSMCVSSELGHADHPTVQMDKQVGIRKSTIRLHTFG